MKMFLALVKLLPLASIVSLSYFRELVFLCFCVYTLCLVHRYKLCFPSFLCFHVCCKCAMVLCLRVVFTFSCYLSFGKNTLKPYKFSFKDVDVERCAKIYCYYHCYTCTSNYESRFLCLFLRTRII